MKLTMDTIKKFAKYLYDKEKSVATQEKYLRDVRAFYLFVDDKDLTKDLVILWKNHLIERNYAISSINSMLASLNSLLDFLSLSDCKVKHLRMQKHIYARGSQELTRAEYMRLLDASKENKKLNMIIKTICGTGIRVSELKYFTVEAVKRGDVIVNCKNKIRKIIVPRKLKMELLKYAKQHRIFSGVIFVTRSGKSLNRSNIWYNMKKLCGKANVNPSKVFPHNLRKLFARTFYSLEKDIAHLADVLGHSSIDTTRIYIMSTVSEQRKKIERMRLIV